METFLQDIRFALRTLRRRPVFTFVAVATLALGVGANTTLFSVIRSVLLRPLPYAEPDRVVALWSSWTGWEKTWISEPEFLDYRDRISAFDEVGVYSIGAGNLTKDSQPERVNVGFLSSGVFEVLGTSPLIGRAYTEDEDRPGSDDVVVISHGLWQRRFNDDPQIAGRTLYFDGEARTILGVMPADFRLPEDYRTQTPTELWAPIAIDEASPGSRGSHYLFGVARLGAGLTLQQASAELEQVASGWVAEGLLPAEVNFRTVLEPVDREVLGEVRPMLWLLLGAVGLVLLIACANVANLLVAASDGRRREIAVRAAIGAGRQRLLRQFLTENILLSCLGGLVGVVLAMLARYVLAQVEPGGIPRLSEVRLDRTVLGYSFGLTLLAALFFGIGPALLISGGPLSGGLREGGRGGTAGPARNLLRKSLIVGEIALSVVLVIGASLMIRSVLELYRIDLGFRTEGALTFRASLPPSDYPEPDDVTRFFAELEGSLESLPNVTAVGATRLLPLTGTIGDWSVTVEGRENLEGGSQGDWQVVTPGYVQAMGIEATQGRVITDADRFDTAPVAMINATMAERYWPGENPVGRRFQMGGAEGPWFTIIGVLNPVRHNAVVEEARTEMYIPHQQFELVNGNPPRTMTLVLSTTASPLSLVPAVREQIRQLDANLPLAEIRTLDEVASSGLARPRFAMLLFGALALLALTLAAVGVYGVISYTVNERRREMGIRLALGAGSGRVRRMVLAEGLKLSAVGIVGGVVAALLLTRLMTALLHGVGRLDPLTFLVVPLLLMLVALLASWVPGRRATQLDPSAMLRIE